VFFCVIHLTQRRSQDFFVISNFKSHKIQMSISPPQKPSFSFLFTVEAPMVDRMKAARVSSLAGGVDLTEKCGPFKCHRLQSVFICNKNNRGLINKDFSINMQVLNFDWKGYYEKDWLNRNQKTRHDKNKTAIKIIYNISALKMLPNCQNCFSMVKKKISLN